MLLCLENDLGFTDQEFWGEGCNSEPGVVTLFDNSCRGGKPRVRTGTHARSHPQRPARSAPSEGSPAPRPRKLSRTAWAVGEGERGEGRGPAWRGRGGVMRSEASVGESFALNHKFSRLKKKR